MICEKTKDIMDFELCKKTCGDNWCVWASFKEDILIERIKRSKETSNEDYNLKIQLNYLVDRIKTHEISFWKRLKFLFSGKLIK